MCTYLAINAFTRNVSRDALAKKGNELTLIKRLLCFFPYLNNILENIATASKVLQSLVTDRVRKFRYIIKTE